MMLCPKCQSEMVQIAYWHGASPKRRYFYRCDACCAAAKVVIRKFIDDHIRCRKQYLTPTVPMPWLRTYRDGTVRLSPYDLGTP